MSRLSAAIAAMWGAVKGAVSPTGGHQTRARVRWEFSAAAVTMRVEAAEERVLERQCALVRKIARQSIRPRRAISSPGSPPSSHHGLLRESIFYRVTGGVGEVGPAQFSTRVGYSVPEILEEGGEVTRLHWEGRRGAKHVARRIRQRFQARPYMRPALEKAESLLPGFWKDAVSG